MAGANWTSEIFVLSDGGSEYPLLPEPKYEGQERSRVYLANSYTLEIYKHWLNIYKGKFRADEKILCQVETGVVKLPIPRKAVKPDVPSKGNVYLWSHKQYDEFKPQKGWVFQR
jgi:hypothetical protein